MPRNERLRVTRPGLRAMFLAWKDTYGILGDDTYELTEMRDEKGVFFYQIAAISPSWLTRREMHHALRFAMRCLQKVHQAQGFETEGDRSCQK